MGLKREVCLIDDDWVTGERIGRVPDLGRAEIDRAVAAAAAAM